MKSKSIWNVLLPYGMGLVVRPLAVTYSVTCQEWLIQGLCVRRILPTICVHMCKVAQVSLHASRGRLGHVSASDRLDIGKCSFCAVLRLNILGDNVRISHFSKIKRRPTGLNLIEGGIGVLRLLISVHTEILSA